MEGKTWWEFVVDRARDLRTMLGVYLLVALGSLFLIVFGSAQLSSQGKLAVAAFIVLTAFGVAIWNDGALRDIGLGAKDMDSDLAATNVGKSWAKGPFGVFRILLFIIVAGIAVTQVMALYS